MRTVATIFPWGNMSGEHVYSYPIADENSRLTLMSLLSLRPVVSRLVNIVFSELHLKLRFTSTVVKVRGLVTKRKGDPRFNAGQSTNEQDTTLSSTD